MTQDMKDLIERLEKASEGSRELDADVWHAADPEAHERFSENIRPSFAGRQWTNEEIAHARRHNALRVAPRFTTSLDAALTLVPEGYEWTRHMGANGKMTMQVDGPGIRFGHGQGATPALALCIAALKARSEA